MSKKKKDMNHIGSIVENLNLPKHQSSDQKRLFTLATQWKSVVGKTLFQTSSPLSLFQGKLVVGVTDPTLMFECQNLHQAWIKKINTFLQAEEVEKIVFKLITPTKTT